MAGKTYSFEVKRTSSAPPATLFRLEADGTRWSEWAKPLRASWDQPGDPPGELGAVRRVGRWPVFVREKTVEYHRDRRHVYELISPPSPAKDYRAEAIFTPTADGGTDFVWRRSPKACAEPGRSCGRSSAAPSGCSRLSWSKRPNGNTAKAYPSRSSSRRHPGRGSAMTVRSGTSRDRPCRYEAAWCRTS
jgi:Polyketide cyclase / dehydrase and lipid transport